LSDCLFHRGEREVGNCPLCRGQLGKNIEKLPWKRDETEMRNRVIGRMIALFDSIGLDVQRTVSSRSGRRFTFADLVNEAFEGD
jgi:hypothetical protein